MTDREKLENRRKRTPVEFELNGHTFTGGAGHYPDGRIGEVFLSGNKPNSLRDIEVKDAAIAASLALQYGCPVDVLRHAFLRDDTGSAAGPLGRLFDVLVAATPPFGWPESSGFTVGDMITIPMPRRLTWWDRVMWNLFRLERKRPLVDTGYVVTDTYANTMDVEADQ